jgi:hypothetical protein
MFDEDEIDTPDLKDWLYPFLAELGITRIEASLSGSGDSGDIDDVTWFKGDLVITPEGEDVDIETPDSGAVLTWFVSGGAIVRMGDPLCEVDPVEARELLSLCREKISVLEELEQRQSQSSVPNEGGPDTAEVEKARAALAERIRWLETRTKALSTQIKERDPLLLPDGDAPEETGIGRQREALEDQIPGLEERAALTLLTAPADGYVNTFDPSTATNGFRAGEVLFTLTPLSHIDTILSKMTLDDGSFSPKTFLDEVHTMLDKDASAAGNWYDGDGGSVFSTYDLDPELGRIRLIDADYTPGEDYGDDEEEDWEPEFGETEEDEDDPDVEP